MKHFTSIVIAVVLTASICFGISTVTAKESRTEPVQANNPFIKSNAVYVIYTTQLSPPIKIKVISISGDWIEAEEVGSSKPRRIFNSRLIYQVNPQ